MELVKTYFHLIPHGHDGNQSMGVGILPVAIIMIIMLRHFLNSIYRFIFWPIVPFIQSVFTHNYYLHRNKFVVIRTCIST